MSATSGRTRGHSSSDDTLRALDSMERVLEAFGNLDERCKIRELRHDLLRQMFEETSRAERRKTAAKPTEGQPQAGLTPWREIITPHADVAAGRFDQAEFAADLFEVLQGTADAEYQEPAGVLHPHLSDPGSGESAGGGGAAAVGRWRRSRHRTADEFRRRQDPTA